MPDFVDAFALLNDASAALGHNELVQSDSITLYEATSAIEIGEPRMDTGVYTDEEKAYPQLDATRALLPQEVLWIMDGMLELETNWLQGYALAQTIFTCSYIHALDQLDLDDVFIRRKKDPLLPVELTTVVLRAYLRGILKTCDIVMEELLKGHAVDNEDYVSDKGGMSLLEDVEIDVILEELAQAEQWLMAWTGPSLSHCGDYRSQLLARLQLRTSILCAVCLFAVDPPIYDQVAGHTEAAKQRLAYIRREPFDARAVPSAFNPHLGKHLETLAPPRPSLPSRNRDSVFHALERLLDGLESAVDLTEAQSWTAIQQRFFKQTRLGNVYPYLRSLHQSVFYHDQRFCGGNRPLRWLGKVFLRDTAGCPEEVWSLVEAYSEMEPKELSAIHGMIALLGQLAWRLLDYITYIGKNQPRQYRKLAKLLHLWDTMERTLQDVTPIMQDLLERHQVVYDLSRIRLALWSMQTGIRQHILLLGFKLDLYAPEELPMVCWYLTQVVGAAQDGTAVQMHVPLAGSSHQHPHVTINRRIQCTANAMSFALVSKGKRIANDSYARELFSRRLSWARCGPLVLQPDWTTYVRYHRHLEDRSAADLLGAAYAQLQTGGITKTLPESQNAGLLLQICLQQLSDSF